ncbi:MAG: hypothetical protein H8E84_08190 [Flavobacteriales bacterium]|nr:hypothetical protein [Flavobacteriales bacterium]
MKKTILALSAALLTVISVNAQEGKPSVKIFSNFNYDLSAEEGENAFKAFEIKRSYLGYSYKFDEKFSTKITFDVGSNDGGSAYTAYLKVATLQWKATDNLTLNIGQQGVKNFKFMEKAWGKRYIAKSAQDKYKWSSSSDQGVTADYKLSDKLSFDAQVLNGEGYKKSQDNTGLMRGGLGMTYKAMDNLSLRLHHDITPRATYTENDASQSITTIAFAYSGNNFTLGGEKNLMKNVGNVLDAENDMMSVYGAYNLTDKYTLFARYDDASETAKAGTYTVYGIERQMTKGVTVALNMQSWTDAAEGSEAENTLYLNLEYKF